MSNIWNLEELDVDGAVRETAAKVDPVTRASFLKKAGIGVGAVAGGGALMGLIPGIAAAAVPASDVAILNFALTLEYLEAAFYAEAKAHSGSFSPEVRKFASVVAGHEATHVAFLKKALGSAAVKKPSFDFKGTPRNQAKFLATATVLEDTGVSAYAGQAPLLKTKSILSAALSIHSVEARHAAWVRDIRKAAPAPTAFDPAKTKGQILSAVKGTGFIVG
jgi:rubrerythrin